MGGKKEKETFDEKAKVKSQSRKLMQYQKKKRRFGNRHLKHFSSSLASHTCTVNIAIHHSPLTIHKRKKRRFDCSKKINRPRVQWFERFAKHLASAPGLPIR